MSDYQSDELSRKHTEEKCVEDIIPSFGCSLMRPGDKCNYRSSTVDKYQNVVLSQVPVSDENLIDYNKFLVSKEPKLGKMLYNIWIPRIIDPKYGDSKIMNFLKTGGRTSMFESSPAGEILLNLKYFGWSDTDVYQEFKPELKGAGTTMADSGVSLDVLENNAKSEGQKKLLTLINEIREQKYEPLCISSKDDRGRPKGSQIDVYEAHAMNVTNMLQTGFPVKFAPLLAVHRLPSEVRERIKSVNKAMTHDETLCSHSLGDYVQSIRLTPSTVRAVYLDKANDDSTLVELIKRISTDAKTLEHTTESMIADTRRYLDAIVNTTRQSERGYLWAKVGDIHLSWQDDSNPKVWDESEVERYKNNHDFAWYLAKDMTIAAGTGYWFVDLESLRAGPRYQLSQSDDNVNAREDLFRKHELYVTCVLRDLNRVTTQFEVGRRLLEKGSVSFSERRDISQNVLDAMIAEANKDEYIHISKSSLFNKELKVQLYYPQTDFEFCKNIPIKQISQRY
jgi:hypothetical protein